jgi:hypothetical protein
MASDCMSSAISAFLITALRSVAAIEALGEINPI